MSRVLLPLVEVLTYWFRLNLLASCSRASCHARMFVELPSTVSNSQFCSGKFKSPVSIVVGSMFVIVFVTSMDMLDGHSGALEECRWSIDARDSVPLTENHVELKETFSVFPFCTVFWPYGFFECRKQESKWHIYLRGELTRRRRRRRVLPPSPPSSGDAPKSLRRPPTPSPLPLLPSLTPAPKRAEESRALRGRRSDGVNRPRLPMLGPVSQCLHD
ncbi:uncharacterized protein LOC143032566 [Oratosquilla oratoria]|uniref:uncharacterized protein LOC143032566 n=1 Tax=Oratosquilla oratoria TaxID=337810 RepID=UPI003F75A47E